MDFKMEIDVSTDVKLSVDSDPILDASVDEYVHVTNFKDEYTGATIVTPTNTQIVLNTRDKVINDDIIIEPIPSNYGRIEWDGATLTII